MQDNIRRSPIRSLERPKRTLAERFALVLPERIFRRVVMVTLRRPAGSRLRRLVLTRSQQLGWEAINRADTDLVGYHPGFEFRFDDPGRIGIDIKQVYYGAAGVGEMIKIWHSGFEQLRFEPRELLDPGGDRFAARYEMIGRAGDGIELREDQWSVWTFRDYLCERQTIYWSETKALDALTQA
jgi:hypothetical protein